MILQKSPLNQAFLICIRILCYAGSACIEWWRLRGIMENNEDKYANLDLNKIYEYKELPDKIISRPKS